MNHVTVKAAAGLLLAVASGAASAHPPQYTSTDRLGLVLEGSIEGGGDEVATIGFSDGSTEEIRAGEGLTLGGGLHFQPANSPLDLRATVGYKFNRSENSDSDLGMSRTVWELVATTELGDGFWIGGGLSHHTNIRFDADDFGPDLDFDDATGYTLEIGWSFLALTYTGIEYTDGNGNDYDAGNFGLSLIGRF